MTIVDIKLGDRSYTVHIERGAASDVSQFENVVTDKKVFEIYGESLLKGRKDVFQIPEGVFPHLFLCPRMDRLFFCMENLL